jgi:hypothetical protein
LNGYVIRSNGSNIQVSDDVYFTASNTGPVGSGTLLIRNSAAGATNITLTANEVSIQGALQFDNLTTTQRGALTPSPGMVIYNISTAKLQVYAGEQIDINTKVFNQMSSDLTKIYASTVQIGASSTMNLSAGGVGSFKAGSTLQFSGAPIHLNTSPAPTVAKPDEIPKLLHADTTFNSGTGLWEIQADKLTSIVVVAPTHEPWKREGGTSESSAVGG